MSIIELLASSQGSRSSDANIKLAIEISSDGNSDALAELVDLLQHSNKNIQSDSIKTLSEIGFRNAQLIAKHV